MNVLDRPRGRAKAPKTPRTLRRRLFFWTRLLLFTLFIIYWAVAIAGTEIFTHSPNRNLGPVTPTDYGLNYREVSFPAREDHLTIRGWFVPVSGTRVVLVLHGKDGNRTSLLEQSTALAQAGYSLLLIDMRGEGRSDGSNYSYGFYEPRDVLGAIDWLEQSGFGAGHIGIYGASMGAATGLLTFGSNPDVKAMVSDSAYANLGDELRYGYKVQTGGKLPDLFFPGMLVTARLFHGIDIDAVRPEDAVRHLDGRHLLLIQGDQDGLVPVENSRRLKEAAGNAADLWIVPGADHVQSFQRQPEEYRRRLVQFFEREIQ